MDKKLMNISISMMLLKLLENQDMYGYEMIKELEARSENVFSLKEGTLYPALHALEADGAIESYEKVSESGRIRKYYRISKKGTKILADKTKEWNTYQKAVNLVIGGNGYGTAVWSN
ncbi:PadR family transcriptional regulator [Anaerocolumna sp. AGMB13025]|uniref:PadR family transcriptional regulator n=1 Tax=Anaerocolumna sp. AGMB13025 TaxID=3039116 RepID=UPI002F3E8472